MLLKDYIVELLAVVDEHPEANNYEVIYSIDDEGNHFEPVWHIPAIGNYSSEQEWTIEQDCKDYNLQTNAVLLN